MDQNLLHTSIVTLLGIDTLPEEEQAAFIEEIGEVILETALLKLTASLDETSRSELEHYLDTNPAPEDLVEELATRYPQFGEILDATVLEIKADAVAVLGDQ